MARVFKRVLIAGAMSTNSKSWKWVGRQYNVSKWFYNPIYEDCKVSQRSNFYKLLFDLFLSFKPALEFSIHISKLL